MFNIIFNYESKVYVQTLGKFKIIDKKIDEYLNSICLVGGATLDGHLKASQKLLPNTKKVPIYLSIIDDYFIPLTSSKSIDCAWISARNFLTCYEEDGKSFIKFKDRSIYTVTFSLFTIRMQYRKYLELEKKRNELKHQYGFLQ